MAAVRPDTQIKIDLLHCVLGNVINVHYPMVEIDLLRFVLEKDSDVRDE